MQFLKFIVIFIINSLPVECYFNYCKVCLNHTLCKYNVPGPSKTCKGYDYSGMLSKYDIQDILQKINERRNFIALGLSKKFPSAANMNKIRWSDELATFAQRWADQCDTTVHPHKHDLCRDLDGNVKVGQTIATVVGSTQRLNVKSLVEIWFMQILEYSGHVSFYNQSNDRKTNDFTQLIWAETYLIGCGKAIFFDDVKKVERLVCNFAPKGNNHRKPIYSIGLPATQCSNDKIADLSYAGLCDDRKDMNPSGKTTALNLPKKSLLRILNLQNDTSLNLNPVESLRQPKTIVATLKQNRNQKIRHVPLNISRSLQRVLPFQAPNFWLSNNNYSKRHQMYHGQQEKGHSRIYHNHQHGIQSQITFGILDLKKYTTTPLPQHTQYQNSQHQQGQCTRKQCDNRDVRVTNRCTRGENNECFQPTSPCPQSSQCSSTADIECPPNLCSCILPIITPPQLNLDCPCCTSKFSTFAPNANKGDYHKCTHSSEFHYYDLWPKVLIRSGDKDATRSVFVTTTKQGVPHDMRQTSKGLKQVKNRVLHPKLFEEDEEYLNYYFDSSRRRKRALNEEITHKPFWKMDEKALSANNLQLRMLKYTTLSKKKNVKTQDGKPIKQILSTEPITITSNKKSLTEKYLSFEELMHLRKMENADYDTRRKGDEHALRVDTKTTKATTTEKSTSTTKTTQQTTEYTANTPFLRKKQCTRKLTCTWSLSTKTDASGRIINGGGGKFDHGGSGSHTPPGYVDGCTRTSTCSRMHLDRNKKPTSEGTTSTLEEDEDYCEKRALNRRNLENTYMDTFIKSTSENRESSQFDHSYCQCNEAQIRFKRGDYDIENRKKMLSSPDEYNKIKYGELFYLIIRKLTKPWKSSKRSCICNKSYSNFGNPNKLLLSLFICIFLIY